MKLLRDKSGTVMIELLLVLPVMLTLFVGSMEFGKLLKRHHIMSGLSRDAANASFRTCAFIDELVPVVNPMAIDNCLRDEVQTKLNNYMAINIPTARIIYSVYRINTALGTVTRIGVYPNGAVNGSFASRYTPDTIPDGVVNFPLTALNNKNPIVAIAEVFYNYQLSANSYVKVIPGYTLYETTIY